MKSLIHALSVAVADSSVSDGELLARFADGGDEAAFEMLVRRHADLVWRVCRGELPGDRHSAEDAFQATFLVLARKARSIREPSAAGFLFRVARNAALRARKRVGRVAEAVADAAAEARPDAVAAGECSAAVVAEVGKLPDKFRLPVLLCFFEDCTHGEAAERLGWAVGTVASRLARAKDRLRDGLSRKGFALPSVLAGAAATGADVRAAVAMATTSSAVPAGVSELTREVLIAMWNTKAKLVGGGLLAVLLAGGFGLTALTAGPQPDQPRAKAQPKAKAPEKPIDAELKKLQGMWRVTKIETERGSAPAKELEGMRWEIVGNIILAQDTPDQKGMGQTRFTIDPTKSPKWITMTLVSLPKGDTLKTMDGIYELKGNTLRICCVEGGKARPTEFKVNKAVESGLLELERIPDAIKSLKDLAGEWRVLSSTKDGKDVAGADQMTLDVHRDVAWLIDGKTVTRLLLTLDAEKGVLDLTQVVATVDPPVVQRIPGRFTWKDNRLTLVMAPPGQPRPAEATSGKNESVMVLTRGATK